MSIESVMPSNHLIPCRPLLLSSIFSSIRVFSNESALHIRWPKYWSFSFNISPSNEHPGLISFQMDCLDLLAVQGTLKSLLQHYSSKSSKLQRSAFFIVQLSHPHRATGKTIALTRWTCISPILRSTLVSHFSISETGMCGDGGGVVARSRLTLVILWTVARQAPLSMGFSRQEYWSGLPFPSPGDLPTQGSNPGLLHCRWIFIFSFFYQLHHQQPHFTNVKK